MKIGTAAEYNRATATSGAAKAILTGKRYQTVSWTYCGTIIAEKTTIFKYGKPVGEPMYSVNPDYIKTGELVTA
jgi:hypothetical protein